MIDFSEYSELIDNLSKPLHSREMDWRICTVPYHKKHNLLWYATINDFEESEAYFETIINQGDSETLNKLLPYFTEGTKIEKMISDRISLLQKYETQGTLQKNKPMTKRENSFFQYLCTWIDKKGFKSDSAFYNHAGISRQVFSKLRNGQLAVSRELALHMAVALGLNYDDGVEFLNHAGYCFNPDSRREQIISFLMRKRTYTFYEMEEFLSVLHEKSFLDWD